MAQSSSSNSDLVQQQETPRSNDETTECRPSRKRKRVYNYKYCSHCDRNVSKSTYYLHKRVQYSKQCNDDHSGSSSDSDPQVQQDDSLSLSNDTPDGNLEGHTST